MVYISTLASLARNYGVIDTLSDAVKQDVAKGITLKAKEGYNRNPIAANALFLLAAGLEAATLPGEDAEMVVAYATSFSDMAEEFVTESGQGVATGVGTVSVD
jgi:hypothetical protein